MKFCSTPGCSEKVDRGRCPAHQQARRRLERRYYSGDVRPTDRYYPPVNYGRRWQRESRRFLAAHPFCVQCERERPKEKVLSTQTDHVVPHLGDPALFWNEANWQPLCGACHSRKTAREVGLGGAR